MSDARWSEIDHAVASAVRHFCGAVALFAKLATAGDRYLVEMAFLHAMLAGQTSLEAALLRIVNLFGEHAPTGPAVTLTRSVASRGALARGRRS